MNNKFRLRCYVGLRFNLESMKQNTITMKKSIKLFTVLFISSFFLISLSDLNAAIVSFYTIDYENSIDNKKKKEKRSNDIKTKVKEKEIPPANEYSSSPKNDEPIITCHLLN